MRFGFLHITLALSLLLAAGCASTAPSAKRAQSTGDILVDGKHFIEHGPEKDKVLWQYRTAVAALRRGDREEAKRLLDDAILSIGGIIANDRDAKRARGYFSAESKKKFMGEPYERIMAYYYRGVLYWIDGEPDNARACFRSGQFIDSDVENQEYAADWVLLEYLDGLSTEFLAGDGSDAFARAQKANKFGAPVPYNKSANALFFMEFGQGPQKYATGQYSQELRFRPGRSRAHSAQVKVDGKTLLISPYDDLYYQATTRGGRVMDHILANKAVFKSATDTAGNAALLSGIVLSGNRNTQEAALGLAAFGVLSKIVSATTTPAADTRAWDNLPQYLSFGSLQLAPGQYTATVEFKDQAGNVLADLSKVVSFTVKSDEKAVVFVSDQSSTPQTI